MAIDVWKTIIQKQEGKSKDVSNQLFIKAFALTERVDIYLNNHPGRCPVLCASGLSARLANKNPQKQYGE